jgi:hypothetical protein
MDVSMVPTPISSGLALFTWSLLRIPVRFANEILTPQAKSNLSGAQYKPSPLLGQTIAVQ